MISVPDLVISFKRKQSNVSLLTQVGFFAPDDLCEKICSANHQWTYNRLAEGLRQKSSRRTVGVERSISPVKRTDFLHLSSSHHTDKH